MKTYKKFIIESDENKYRASYAFLISYFDPPIKVTPKNDQQYVQGKVRKFLFVHGAHNGLKDQVGVSISKSPKKQYIMDTSQFKEESELHKARDKNLAISLFYYDSKVPKSNYVIKVKSDKEGETLIQQAKSVGFTLIELEKMSKVK